MASLSGVALAAEGVQDQMRGLAEARDRVAEPIEQAGQVIYEARHPGSMLRVVFANVVVPTDAADGPPRVRFAVVNGQAHVDRYKDPFAWGAVQRHFEVPFYDLDNVDKAVEKARAEQRQFRLDRAELQVERAREKLDTALANLRELQEAADGHA